MSLDKTLLRTPSSFSILTISWVLHFLWGDRGCRGWYDSPQSALRPSY